MPRALARLARSPAAPCLIALLGSAGCEGGGEGGDPCASGVTVTGVVHEFQFGVPRQKFPGLGDVEICVRGEPDIPCVRSSGPDKGGTFQLCGVPENSRVQITFGREGYLPMMRQLETRTEDYDLLAETVLGKVEDGASVVDQQGYEVSTGGAIQFFGITPGNGVLQVATLAGYSVELSRGGAPASCGVGAEAGPCVASYLGTTGVPDPALQESTAIGVGAFGNVPAGEYVLTFSHPDMACTERLPESGFAGPTEDSITVEVVEGYITAQVGMVCQPGVL